MEGFKKCSRGHYYSKDIENCPYCPQTEKYRCDLCKEKYFNLPLFCEICGNQLCLCKIVAYDNMSIIKTIQIYYKKPQFIFIGNSKSTDIQFCSQNLSEKHAKIFNDDFALYIVDLASVNGIYIDDEKLKPNVPYKINFGRKIFFDKQSNLYIIVIIENPKLNTIIDLPPWCTQIGSMISSLTNFIDKDFTSATEIISNNEIKIIGDSNIALENVKNNQININQNIIYQKNNTIEKRTSEIGNIAYDIPENMILKKASMCIIRISKHSYSANILRRTEKTILEKIRISDVMKVYLIDPNNGMNFKITNLSSVEQIISENEHTEWIFNVIPVKQGNLNLILRVTITEILEHYNERSKDIIVLDKTINVQSISVISKITNLIKKA